jgi:hypothetical protein
LVTVTVPWSFPRRRILEAASVLDNNVFKKDNREKIIGRIENA